jgi:hypothetical protein
MIESSVSELPNGNLKTEIINLCQKAGMRTSKLLGMLDLSKEMPKLEKYFGEEWRYRLFGAEAKVKLIFFRVGKELEFCTETARHLAAYPEDAIDLGFTKRDENGSLILPDHETIRYDEKERFGVEGLVDIFNILLEAIRVLLMKVGIKLGRNVGIDSVPIRAPETDKEAEYNGHYKLMMYKGNIVVDLDTHLPLAAMATLGTQFDGECLPLLVNDVLCRRIEIENLNGDGHYNELMNYSFLAHEKQIRPTMHITAGTAYDWNASEESLKRFYRTLHTLSGYLWEDVSFDFILRFLAANGYKELIGRHFRNCSVHEYEECPDGYLDRLHMRNQNESIHGVLKNFTSFGRMKVKGIENAKIHLAKHLIMVLAFALVKLQNGITDGLTKIAYFC